LGGLSTDKEKTVNWPHRRSVTRERTELKRGGEAGSSRSRLVVREGLSDGGRVSRDRLFSERLGSQRSEDGRVEETFVRGSKL